MIKVKAIIAGSRHIECAGIVHMAITEAVKKHGWDIVEVVSGGARGVDAVGEALSRQHGRKVKVFQADWVIYGNAAGPIRNRQMALYADVLILVHSHTRGSLNMKQMMLELNKPIYEVIVNDDGTFTCND